MRARGQAGVLLVVAVTALVGCHRPKGLPYDPNVVATVNGEPITRAAFEKDLRRDLQMVDPIAPRSPEQLEPYRRALLDTLIERTLLLQEARRKSLTVQPEEVDRRVLRISADYPAEGFEAALAQGELSLAELKQKTADLLLIEKLFTEHVYPRVGVTEEELRDAYEAHKAEYALPEEVRAQQIVVRDVDEARRIQQLLRSGKKFGDLARKYSLSADANVGGDLGFFARGVMPPQFDEVAFKLAVGQISDVVASDYGYHLFKVLEKRPARQRELAEVRGEVEKKLLHQKQEAAQREFVALLRKGAQIVVNEPVLQSLGPVVAAQGAAPPGDSR